MKRRRTNEPPRREPRPAPFHAPFETLRAQVKARERADGATPARNDSPPALRRDQSLVGRDARAGRSRVPPSSSNGTLAPAVNGATPATQPDRDDDLTSFLHAVADVRRIENGGRIDAPPPAIGGTPRVVTVDEEAEALATLSDLVSGTGGFDISDSSEYVEGAVVGLDARILRRLRHGEFPYHATLDLHGMTAAAARAAVEAFIMDAFRAGHRCVLVVHGRGRNSRQQIPVLKEGLKQWLAHGRVGRVVLAFTSARPADGGTGAVYVLLRRRRGAKEPITVLDGAKRE